MYLSKMILHDFDLIRKYSLKYLGASTVYITIKIVEQVRANLDIEIIVDKLKKLLSLNEDVFYESSEEIL